MRDMGAHTVQSSTLVSGYAEHRIAMNLTADFLFIASLFVLGGNFWEKFRALFIYDESETN